MLICLAYARFCLEALAMLVLMLVLMLVGNGYASMLCTAWLCLYAM